MEENVAQLSKRTVQFVMSYRQMQEQTCKDGHVHPKVWKPPTMGILKLNFDSGKIGEHGWGGWVCGRGYDRAIVLAVIREAKACLFALQTA